jgi:hypothetical protein
MEEKVVLYHTKNNIAFITLNRPERFNAIDPYLPYQLKEVIKKKKEKKEEEKKKKEKEEPKGKEKGRIRKIKTTLHSSHSTDLKDYLPQQ